MPGGKAAPVLPKTFAGDELTLGKFVDGSAGELEKVYFECAIPASMGGVKIVLVPVSGDSDLFISFDHPRPSRMDAAFTDESIGVKQIALARGNPHFCPAPSGSACKLYLTVSGYEEGDFKLAVYNYSSEGEATSAAWSCSEGCDELRLGNTRCDAACNTSSCMWDQGDCGFYGLETSEQICSTGCALSWKGDGYCDEACFNAACDWDAGDCITADHGCADGCLPSWIDDEECDELCNVEACGWDGVDCDHGVDDCYTDPNGTDYRGSISVTLSGYTCQQWSSQAPHPHRYTYLTYPNAGLGGHNHCRNPGTAATAVVPHYNRTFHTRCARCQRRGRAARGSAVAPTAQRSATARCAPLTVRQCLETASARARCNISSCAYDAGDCGVGLDLTAILADQGYVVETSSSLAIMVVLSVGFGLAIGLAVLRMTLARLKREELKRRGYTTDEARGMDNYDEGDDE